MKKALVWLRRDLRLHDQAALSYATNSFDKVYLIFVFDDKILNKLENKKDARVEFIYDSLMHLQEELKKYSSNIIIVKGDPCQIIPEVAQKLKVDAVVANRDYEVYAKDRDQKVLNFLSQSSIDFITCKDTVVFEADEVLTKTGGLFKVFTPYKNAWLAKLENHQNAMFEYKVALQKLDSTSIPSMDLSQKIKAIKSLADIGFEEVSEIERVDGSAAKTYNTFVKKIKNYSDHRDFPAIEGTSRLSVHLRFGTISTRQLVRAVWPKEDEGTRVWLSELIWREFYFALLDKNPHVEKHAYQSKYENLTWDNDKQLYKAWCEGRTGVPIVDAGMRQLNQTGWMHNRLRMITASYLIKTLLIDWRWGEKYFAQKLIDFDLAANNGGWQWAASTGCDAAPYFRVFNPYRQSERFDKKGEFIRRYCPELSAVPDKFIHGPYLMPIEIQVKASCRIGQDYPAPIADYAKNRIRAINMFKEVGE